MTEPSTELKKLLARAKLVVLPEDYVVIHLPVGVQAIPGEWFRPATTRFAVVIQEPNVITMIVTRRKWLRMQGMFDNYEVNGPFKVVSFDVNLSLTATGSMSTISSMLTGERINAIPISSFKGDHLIVPKTELPRTVKVLRGFLQSCKKP